jgi:hypothetical protein
MTRILGEGWAVPALDDSNRAFFTSGSLTLQQCRGCAHIQHPPEDVCDSCQSFDLGHFESVGRGRVESVVVVHHPVHPGIADRVPYAIVLVSIDDAPGVLVAGNVVRVAPESIAIGDRVRVVFEDASDPNTGQSLKIPQWEIVPE